MTKVSILVPVYGVEKYIEKCARSLFEQSYENIEYVFVDDCSPDNSINVLNHVIDDYPQRKSSIKIIRHKENMGLAAARNTGILNANGDYIFNMDSDDYLELNAIEILQDAAKETNADIVTCDYKKVYPNRWTILKSGISEDKTRYIRNLLTRRTSFNLSGKLIRKALITKNDIHAISGVNQAEDYITYPRLAYYAEKITYVNKPLYNYIQYNATSYIHNVSDDGREQIIRASKYLINFFTKTDIIKKDPQLIPDMVFYNKWTLFIVSPYRKYPEINNAFDNITSAKNDNLSGMYMIINFCIKNNLYLVLWLLVRVRLCMRR